MIRTSIDKVVADKRACPFRHIVVFSRVMFHAFDDVFNYVNADTQPRRFRYLFVFLRVWSCSTFSCLEVVQVVYFA